MSGWAAAWRGAIDFVFLTAAFYLLLGWSRKARALRLVVGITVLLGAAALARHSRLFLSAWILDGAAILLVLVLLVAFQAELRSGLMQIDGWLRGRRGAEPAASDVVAEAAFNLAAERVGAIFVLVRHDSIGELTTGGVLLDGVASKEVLETVFQKSSPVHDGAVIVDSGRVERVGSVLPLTRRTDLPRFYGTRHRAAAGLSERCDAVAVVVSEQRGVVSVFHDGASRAVENRGELRALLRSLSPRPKPPLRSAAWSALSSNLKLKMMAVALAALTWTGSVLIAAPAVRTFHVPVEFVNVPAGMEVFSQSTTSLEVQARGAEWLLNAVDPLSLVAQFDLARATPGTRTFRFRRNAVNLPAGLNIERVEPPAVSLRLGPVEPSTTLP